MLVIDRTRNTTPSPQPRAGTTENNPPRFRRLRRALRPKILGPVLAVLLVSGGGVAGWLHLDHLTELRQARGTALDAGRQYASTIASYDYRKPKENQRAVVRHATDSFATQYRDSSDKLTELIKQNKASAQATVLDAAVAEVNERRAVVLAFVDQKVTNSSLKEPRVDRSRMRLTLLRSGDRWELDEVQLR